jgi:hypothetical protein
MGRRDFDLNAEIAEDAEEGEQEEIRLSSFFSPGYRCFSPRSLR